RTHLTITLSGRMFFTSFLRSALDVAITVDVPVHFEGEAKGVKEGGVLEHHLWQLHVECLPGNVPECINIDVTEMDIGSIVRVSYLRPLDGVSILTAEGEIIVM